MDARAKTFIKYEKGCRVAYGLKKLMKTREILLSSLLSQKQTKKQSEN